MDQKTHDRIEEIEAKTAEIDAEIRRLRAEREAVLLSDEEYADYIQAYEAYFEGDPLSLRQYYEKRDELSAINAKFFKPDVDYEALWQQHGPRIAELERMLAA